MLGLGLAALLVGLGTGCVHYYQPLEGLNTPVVVDTTALNFTDLALTVHCVPSTGLPPDGEIKRGIHSAMCRKVVTLFENQGAVVTLVETEGLAGDAYSRMEEEEASAERETDLILELRPQHTVVPNNNLSWVLFYASASILPAVSETPMALEVIVRDEGGFLLAQERLEGRVVRHAGFGAWASNALANKTWRNDSDKRDSETASREFSEDFYGQLSQIVLNASMQWRIMQQPVAGRGR